MVDSKDSKAAQQIDNRPVLQLLAKIGPKGGGFLSTTKVVDDGQVVTLSYTLSVDGEVVDTSEGNEPIQFIQGQGEILPGLEDELYGMSVGESKNVVLEAPDGYGEIDSEAFSDVPRTEFPVNIPLEPGVELQLKSKEGEVFEAMIDSVNDKTVRLNFNHPLAGKELHFSVKIIELREATAEEMDHGHAHTEQGH